MKTKDFSNNQGCINANVVKLLGNPEELKKYTDTLTEEQVIKARDHTRTVLKIRKKMERLKNC